MKYLIIFILACNFSVNAMTIECLLKNTPKERIYLDVNFDMIFHYLFDLIFAAFINEENKGCGAKGLDLNSG